MLPEKAMQQNDPKVAAASSPPLPNLPRLSCSPGGLLMTRHVDLVILKSAEKWSWQMEQDRRWVEGQEQHSAGAGVARVGWLSWKWVLARVSSMGDSQADSLQVLQALVHLQGLSQGHGTSISNGIAGKPARDNGDGLGLGVRAQGRLLCLRSVQCSSSGRSCVYPSLQR